MHGYMVDTREYLNRINPPLTKEALHGRSEIHGDINYKIPPHACDL